MGGSILGGTNKGTKALISLQHIEKAQEHILFEEGVRQLDLDGLICIGGDGSLQILNELSSKTNVPMVFIPKTIDNDIGFTDLSIGYMTTVGVVVETLDRLRPTAISHDRTFVLEVMGRDAGHIALASGIAGGADVILIPEIAYTIEGIVNKIKDLRNNGQHHAMIVVSESVPTESGETLVIMDRKNTSRYGGIAHYISEKIEQSLEGDVRFNVLGHSQRGASPCAQDRLLATQFGIYAIDLLMKKKFGRVVVYKDNHISDVELKTIYEANGSVRKDDFLVKTAKSLGIYMGNI
jgi:6-phosphofructokinase 1